MQSPPSPLLAELQHRLAESPVSAVESHDMLNLYSQDPVFCRLLSVEDQWRLLYGLAISLLDYSEVLDLTVITLPFPGQLQSLSLWQICDALTCADFRLDWLDWVEEHQCSQLSIAQLEACDAVLRCNETQETLQQLIEQALGFISGCDDYLLTADEGPLPRAGLMRRLWRAVRRNHATMH
jgi:hypothetical protein